MAEAVVQQPVPTLSPTLTPTRELELAPARAWIQGDDDGDEDGDGNGDGNVDVLTLLHMRDQIKEQFMECSTAVLAEKENFPDHPVEEKLIQSATQDLQIDTEAVKTALQNKTLALQRIQIMDALRKKIERDDEESRLILKTMENILLLSRTIVEYQQQVHQKEQQLTDIKMKRLLLKDKGQQLQEIRAKKKQKEKQESVNAIETERLLEILEKERETTTILQNVFQNIIFGSGVNWAEDPSLKAIVLQLEKNVYLQ